MISSPSSTSSTGRTVVSDIDQLREIVLELFQKRNTVLPRNTIETQLEAIWREQVGLPSVFDNLLVSNVYTFSSKLRRR
jgi:hypothetical protein